AAVGAVVLRAAEICLPVRIRQAVIELRHRVVVIQWPPNNRRRHGKEATRRKFITADWARRRDGAATRGYATGIANIACLGIIGFVNAAVIAGEQRLIG